MWLVFETDEDGARRKVFHQQYETSGEGGEEKRGKRKKGGC